MRMLGPGNVAGSERKHDASNGSERQGHVIAKQTQTVGRKV